MTTLFITDLMSAKITITNTDLYDIIILPEADGVKTNGRIISVNMTPSYLPSYDIDIDNYCLSLGKNGARVSIGGNYLENTGGLENRDKVIFTGGDNIEIDTNYNLNHLQYNDTGASGALHYKKDGFLVLTAQSGAGSSDKYANSTVADTMYKTDDGIALRSDSYGMYSLYTSSGNRCTYGIGNMPSKPYQETISYTIQADNKLTVVSDLAGKIETNVAAIHTGYQTINNQKNIIFNDDSSNNEVIAAGIKAKELVLESNFRANITSSNNGASSNNGGTFKHGLFTVQQNRVYDEKGKLAEIGGINIIGGISSSPGEAPKQQVITGTTIAGFHSTNANDNDVSTYGIWTTNSLDAKDSIWAGSITAQTNDVSILADYGLIRQGSADDTQVLTYSAHARDNTIAAYGIKSDGNIVIKEMSVLREDSGSNSNGRGDEQGATITVNADKNKIYAESIKTGDNAATADISRTKITAAGIHAENINIGKITEDVNITVTAKDNSFTAIAHPETKADSSVTLTSVGIYSYGIYASNKVEFNNFSGNITVDASDNNYTASATNGTASVATLAYGIKAGTLKAEYLKGHITVKSGAEVNSNYTIRNESKYNVQAIGIEAATITVSGAIYTTIESSHYGIFTTNSIGADAFAGEITSGVGIAVTNNLIGRSGEIDSFDISGNITAIVGVSAGDRLNIRVSGTINSAGGTAIISETGYSPYGNPSSNVTKYNDNVELSDTAVVKGDINLGAGINTITVNSNASFDGRLQAQHGELNLAFVLDGKQQDGHVALKMTDSKYDGTLLDTRTITVNLNSAEAGTYTLIDYQTQDDLSSKWVNRLIALNYQGKAATVSLSDFYEKYDENGELIFKGYEGTTTIKGVDVTVGFNTRDNTLQVTVGEGIKSLLPIEFKDLDETDENSAKADNLLLFKYENNTITLDWNAFANTAKECGLATISAYEIEYSINNGKTILARVNGKTTKLDIQGITPDSTVAWRMRLVGDDNANTVSAWSEWETISKDTLSGTTRADAFVGEITDTPTGITAHGDLVGKTDQDAYDIAGTIVVEKYGIVAYKGMNIRVSGTVGITGSGAAIISEKSVSDTNDYDDKVELAETAVVKGDIDLGAGNNTLTVNSNATFNGSIIQEGVLNLAFILDGVQKEDHVALNLDEMADATISVNLNYAENGTYTLISYLYEPENEQEAIANYWNGRTITFNYQGYAATVSLSYDENGKLTGTTFLSYDENGKLKGFKSKGDKNDVTFTAEFINNNFKVTVDNKPVLSALEFEAEDMSLTYDKNATTLTLNWTEFSKTAPAYEIEYKINGGNSILTRVEGNKELDIEKIASNSTVEWRMRLIEDENANKVSAWSEWETISKDALNNATRTDAFIGEVKDVEVGINSRQYAVCGTDTDSFDIAGTINAKQYGVIANKDLNIRVSGEIEAGTAIISEKSASDTKDHNDKVELAETAVVIGDIDLGAGNNTLTVNSNASFEGSIKTQIKEQKDGLNLVFMLDGVQKKDHVALKLDDPEMEGTTISVDLNYAKEGTYTLIEYAAGQGIWNGRTITFNYQGKTGEITLPEYGDYDGIFIKTENIGGVDVTAKFDGEKFQVIVGEVEKYLVVTYDKENNNKYDVENKTLTLDWNVFDELGRYGLEDVKQYEIEYKVDGGRIVTKKIAGDITDFAIQNIAPDSTVEWRMRLLGSDDTASIWSDWEKHDPVNLVFNYADDQADNYMLRTYDKESRTLTLDWNDFAKIANKYGVENITGYIIEYKIGDKTVTEEVTGTSCVIKNVNPDSTVTWSMRLVGTNAVDGKQVKVESVWSTSEAYTPYLAVNKSEDNSISQTYSQEKTTLTLVWGDFSQSAAQYGVETIAEYEIEYKVNGGETVTEIVAGDIAKLDIQGIASDSAVEWRIRLVGTDGTASIWSDWATHKPYLIVNTDNANSFSHVYNDTCTTFTIEIPKDTTFADAKELYGLEKDIKSYKIEYKIGDGSIKTATVTKKTKTTFEITGVGNLPVEWRICLVDADGAESAWSNWVTEEPNYLAIDSTDTKADNYMSLKHDGKSTLTLDWNDFATTKGDYKITTVEKYEIQYKIDGGTLRTVTVTGGTTCTIENVDATSTVEWRMRLLGKNSEATVWSEWKAHNDYKYLATSTNNKADNYISSTYDKKNAALKLDWNSFATTAKNDYKITDIEKYVIEYKIDGGEIQKEEISIDDPTEFIIQNVELDSTVEWRMRLVGNDGKTSSNWSDWEIYKSYLPVNTADENANNYISSEYDKENKTLTLDWKDDFAQTAEQYGLENVTGYEIEYKVNGGETVTEIVAGDIAKLDIQGIASDSAVEWRMRLLGSDDTASIWSDWAKYTPENLVFNYANDQADNYMSRTYDENSKTLTLDWNSFAKSAAQYGLENVTAYEIEYSIDGVMKDPKTVAGNTTLAITVDATSTVEWRMRLVDDKNNKDKNDDTKSVWSDWVTEEPNCLAINSTDTDADNYIARKYDDVNKTLTLDWKEFDNLANKYGLENIKAYEIEYKINGGETVTEVISGDITEFTIKGIENSDVEWRMRLIGTDNATSAWSAWEIHTSHLAFNFSSATAENYVSRTYNFDDGYTALTLDWKEFDKLANKYGLEKVTGYKIEYSIDGGDPQTKTVTGDTKLDIQGIANSTIEWRMCLLGTNTVGEESVEAQSVWSDWEKLDPSLAFNYTNDLADNYMSCKYNDDYTALTLDWSQFAATANKYGLTNVTAYEIQYKIDGVEQEPETVTGRTDFTIKDIANSTVEWRMRLVDNKNTEIENDDTKSVWSDWKKHDPVYLVIDSTDTDAENYVEYQYNKKNATLTLDWNSFKDTAAQYGLEKVTAYEIEYKIDGGNTILSRVEKDEKGDLITKLDIEKIVNSTVEWRMRLVNDQDNDQVDDQASLWSDWNKIVVSNPSANTDVSAQTFDFTDFTTSVVDANPQDTVPGIVAAVAQCKWDGLQSENNIRNYIIEYCPKAELITLDEALGANDGFSSIEDYLESVDETGFFQNTDLPVYTKIVTGTQVDISDIQNLSFVYWRIKAVDVNGEESKWIAGKMFRVWVGSDITNPVFTENNNKTNNIVSYSINTPDDFKEKAKLTGHICWDSASDLGSGIAGYLVEIKADNSDKWEEFKYIESEEKSPWTMVGYTIEGLDKNATYTIRIKDLGNVSVEAVIIRTKADTTGGEVSTLWFIVHEDWSDKDLSDATFSILDKDGNKLVDGNGNPLLLDNYGKSLTDNIKLTSQSCTIEVYDYAIDIANQEKTLSGAAYDYRVTAIDYYGNKSDPLKGSFSLDSEKPEFSNKNVVVALNPGGDADDVQLTPEITWSPAKDGVGDLGIRYYEITIYHYDEDGNKEIDKVVTTAGTSYRLDGEIPAREYVCEITAYDFFGRSATITKKFGSTDMNAPSGRFTPDTMDATVTSSYDQIRKDVQKVDEDGNPVLDAEGNPVTESVVVGETLKSASVRLTWNDNFTDDSGIIYKVVVSDSQTFSGEAKIYEFWTTPKDGKQMLFSNDIYGRTAGIFEGMDTVYWYVVAYDVHYNKAAELSEVSSFKFTNDNGKPIVSGNAPATPVILSAENHKQGDTYTDKVSVTWTCPANLLGVYSFTVQLIDQKGNVVYEKESCDTSDRLTTDLDPEITVNGNVLSINDLRSFFGETKIEDDKYKIVITSHDASGRASRSEAYDINIDTTKPSSVVINRDKSGAFSSNRGNDDGCTVVLVWDDVIDQSGIEYYKVSYYKDQDESEIGEYEVRDGKTSYSFITSYIGSTYHFKVTAYDKKGNAGYESESWYDIKTVADAFVDTVEDLGKQDYSKFTDNKFVSYQSKDKDDKYQESVGIGDAGDAFWFDMNETRSVDLYVNDLAALVGNNDDVKISLYCLTGNSLAGNDISRVGSWTVNGDSKVFSNVIFEAGKDYAILVESADTKNSVVKYTVTLDSVVINGINEADNAMTGLPQEDIQINEGESANIFASEDGAKNWVGKADPVDGKLIQVEKSGRYTFSLGDTAAAVKVTVYEIDNGKKKSIASISATGKNVSDVTTKELLLDSSKQYYVEVTYTDKTLAGTTYDLSFDCIETFPAPTTDDDVRNNNTPVISVGNDIKGWVGFGDKVDYAKLTVGENGGVYNFTVKHDIANNDQSIKFTIWQENGTDKKGNMTYKSVKTFTISNKEDIKSTGLLYLNEGNYFVEINAPGDTKAQNSSYTLTCNGVEINPDMMTDNNDFDSADNSTFIGNKSAAGFVSGIVDKKDIYKFTVGENGAYEFNITDFNGKELTAAVYKVSANGKTTKVISKTGVNNATAMVLSANLEAGVEYYIEFTANGAKANSHYNVEYSKINADNSDDKILTAKQQATGSVYTYQELGVYNDLTDGWVGFSDTTDFVKLDLDESGLYNINITDIENPVKVTLYQANKKDGEITSYSNIKTVTLKAGTDAGSLSDLLLDKKGEYYVEVTATNGAKGDNTGYDLSLESAVDTLSADTLTADNSVIGGSANITSRYTFLAPADGNGGAYKFSLNGTDVANSNVQLTVYELLANGKTRTVKTVTVKAGANGDTGYLYLDQDVVSNGTGIYMVEVKPSNSKTAGEYTLTIDGYQFADYINGAEDTNNQFGVTNWVGMEDASDTYAYSVDTAGVYTLKLDGINGNNIKISITTTDSKGKTKTVKSFTPAANSTSAEFSYDFAEGEYTIVVSSADNGKSKFSEYTLTVESRVDDIAKTDNSWKDAVTAVAVNETAGGWVGLKDSKDYYHLDVAENGNYTINLGNTTNDVKLTVYEIKNGKESSIGSVTVKAGTGADISNLMLEAEKEYYVCIQASNTSGTKDATYSGLAVTQNWTEAQYADSPEEITVGTPITSAVWKNGNNENYYELVVEKEGSYTFDFSEITGSAIKISIGTIDAKGAFKSIQSITSAKGANAAEFSRLLQSGIYYIKVESTGSNSASEYTIDVTRNNNSEFFKNNDNDWKTVLADVDATRYGNGENMTISDWVGLGDTNDVFKIRLDENGQISFLGDDNTISALKNKEISISLVDSAGKSVTLTLDKTDNSYDSNVILMANVDYFLNVKSVNPGKADTEYNFGITIL